MVRALVVVRVSRMVDVWSFSVEGSRVGRASRYS